MNEASRQKVEAATEEGALETVLAPQLFENEDGNFVMKWTLGSFDGSKRLSFKMRFCSYVMC